MFHQGTSWADERTLTALDARNIVKGSVFGWTDDGIEASVLETKNTNTLGFLTGLNASTAKNTLGSIADNARSNFI